MQKEKKSVKKTDNDGLFIPRRQLSIFVAAAAAVVFVVFMSGYFFGKKHMVEQFVAQVEHDAFADQIYSSMCALYDCDNEPIAIESIASTVDDERVLQKDEQVALEDSPDQPEEIASQIQSFETAQQEPADSGQSYYAQLIGYRQSMRRAAERFAQKLIDKGIPVEVRTRKSSTPKGRTAIWYQVVTQAYADRQALEEIVDSVCRQERLKGVRILSC